MNTTERTIETFTAEYGITAEQAQQVIDLYIAEKIAKFDGHLFSVKHGAFLDKPVILRAVAMAEQA